MFYCIHYSTGGKAKTCYCVLFRSITPQNIFISNAKRNSFEDMGAPVRIYGGEIVCAFFPSPLLPSVNTVISTDLL